MNVYDLIPGGSEQAQRQLFRALRYHTLQDPQLHNTLRDLLASVSTAGKGLTTAARVLLAKRTSCPSCHHALTLATGSWMCYASSS